MSKVQTPETPSESFFYFLLFYAAASFTEAGHKVFANG
jgi:hypothetical protein